MSPETKQFIVAIRNVQWKDHQLFIECGGGVVPESVLEKEIEEIHLKRNTIRKHYL
jgi:isochorismate synthase EntC